MKRVLVLGSTGMLGYMVLDVLSKEVDLLVRGTHMDDPSDPLYLEVVEDFDKLGAICDRGAYDYFINCIGFTADRVDEADSASVLKAVAINTVFPRKLAQFAERRRARVIHMSTDGVFSGKGGPYFEDSPHDCTDVYGKTKSLGEPSSKAVLTVRCSIIGPSPFEKRGLFEWFLSRARGSVVPGFINHTWNGVSTLQFAGLCRSIIKTDGFNALREESQVFHFAPNESITKYDLLRLLQTTLRREVTVLPTESGSGVTRLLKTRYQGVRQLYGEQMPMKDVIEDLHEYLIQNRANIT